MPTNNGIVTLTDVSFQYRNDRKRITALRDISVCVNKGEFLSIIGPSGSGKSTLLRLIAGLTRPTTGTLHRNAAHVAMVFQGHALFPWLTAEENVAFGLEMQGMSKKERLKIAREKLIEVELRGFESRYPHELSGGQHQRVAVARALALSPDLLILDEPFSSLDSLTADDLKKDIAALWERYQMTVVMVSHLIEDAVLLSDRVIVFDKNGSIQKTVHVDLPRPRDARSPQAFELIDHLTGLIR
jgi:NitT/TauT family transport system ATP-binding protein